MTIYLHIYRAVYGALDQTLYSFHMLKCVMCHVPCAICHGSQGPVHVILESPLQRPSQMDGQLEYLQG